MLRKGVELVPLRFIAILFVLMLSRNIAAEAPELTPEQARVLDGVRTLALRYTESLPDFICTQITHRATTEQGGFGMSLNGASSSRGSTPLATGTQGPAGMNDLIEEQLTFFDQMEHYKVVRVNGQKVTGLEHMSFAGAISAGEFGSALRNLFDPRSHATFTFDRVASLAHRRVYIFRFHVPVENGTIVIARDTNQKILAAYSGRLFVDPETFQVFRITSELELPADFRIKMATTTVDYRPVKIAGKTFTLPSRSEVRMKDDFRLYVNQIEFREYHRFAVESTIHYNSDGSPKNQ